MADKYADTNANPYVDKTDNNEKENLNTKTVKRGDKLVYQVWLDTTKFDANNKDYIQTVGITDNYDEKNLMLTNQISKHTMVKLVKMLQQCSISRLKTV